MKGCAGLLALCALCACSQEVAQSPDEQPKADPPEIAETSGVSKPKETAEPVAAPSAAQGTQVACAASEETIFSCTTKTGKQLAVCVGDEGAQYRFGKDTPELMLSGGRWASAAYSGGGEAQIAFDNGDTRYIVFSRMIRTNFAAGEPNNPAISDGVVVEKSGEFVAVLECGGAGELMPVQYSAAESHLPRADELFTYETGRADPF